MQTTICVCDHKWEKSKKKKRKWNPFSKSGISRKWQGSRWEIEWSILKPSLPWKKPIGGQWQFVSGGLLWESLRSRATGPGGQNHSKAILAFTLYFNLLDCSLCTPSYFPPNSRTPHSWTYLPLYDYRISHMRWHVLLNFAWGFVNLFTFSSDACSG